MLEKLQKVAVGVAEGMLTSKRDANWFVTHCYDCGKPFSTVVTDEMLDDPYFDDTQINPEHEKCFR